MKVCEYCKVEFEPKDYRQRCCSRSCSATMNNLKRGLEIKRRRYCLNCEQKLLKSQEKYCSRDCHTAFRQKAYIVEWLEGRNDGSDADGTLNQTCRKHLLTEANNQCTRCGWNEINPVLGYAILTVDHRDGNWKNNSRDNLVVICYNCHTLTPTFGALNRGNGAGTRGTYDRRIEK